MMKMAEVMLVAGATAVGIGLASDPKMKKQMKRMRRQMKRKLHF